MTRKDGTFNQKEYINDFNKSTYKKVVLQIRKDNHVLIDWLDSKPNKTKYILELIENDIEKNK